MHKNRDTIQTARGNFTMKSAYRTSQEGRQPFTQDLCWKKLWRLKIHERVKMFLWRLGNNVPPLKFNLARRLGITDTNCPLCKDVSKNERHLFFDCPLARAIWFDVSWSMRSDAIQVANSQEILNWVLDPPFSGLDACMKSHYSLVWALTLETIWNLINKVLHGNEIPQLHTIVSGLEH